MTVPGGNAGAHGRAARLLGSRDEVLAAEAGRPPGHDERRRWLDVAGEVALMRVDAVVSRQHRGAYRRVALLAVACAEAAALAEDNVAGARFVDACHARHPRHSAFRRELREATAQSPLLGKFEAA